MFDALPERVAEIRDWGWEQFAPYFEDLERRELTADTIHIWLADWTAVWELIQENLTWAQVATTQDTTDVDAENYFKHLLDEIEPPFQVFQNRLNRKLMESGQVVAGMEVPLKLIHTDIELFREANIELATQDQKLAMEYSKITGAQTVEIDGEEKTLVQLKPYYQEQDRDLREQVWALEMGRWLQDRERINELWPQLLDLRQQIAENADYPDYRAYRWQQFHRYDYMPEDCFTFHQAIEAVAVPAAKRVYERRKQRLGVDLLRPWDLDVDPYGRPPLKPFETIDELKRRGSAIFHHVDLKAGQCFDMMIQEDLLDLASRKGKGPGAYCTRLAKAKKPFIFMNVSVRDSVPALLHESGHAFHSFEALKLPYMQQRGYPIEFAEVASMSMELLAGPYLTGANGAGFFNLEEARRYRIEHLEKILLFWPYMAVVDAFQHWVYTNMDDAKDPANCDAKWVELWGRFMPGVDWSGHEDALMAGWHRKVHIHAIPFYYVEYGLAQLGAVQVWANSLEDQAAAVKKYFEALALGYTASLPELFTSAGAKFAFDAGTMGAAVGLIERTIAELEQD